MFLFYQKQNELMCYPQDSPNTSDWNNVNYNVIVCSLLFILLITVLKYSKRN